LLFFLLKPVCHAAAFMLMQVDIAPAGNNNRHDDQMFTFVSALVHVAHQ
jgi:hypothetical protein